MFLCSDIVMSSSMNYERQKHAVIGHNYLPVYEVAI